MIERPGRGPRTAAAMCVILVVGCTRVYWDKEFYHDATERDIGRSQHLRVVSHPPAKLSVDGRLIGSTPCKLDLDYAVDNIGFAKNKYKKSWGQNPRVVETERKVVSVDKPEVYEFEFDADGYDLLRHPVVIPHDRDALSVDLHRARTYWDEDARSRGIRRGVARTETVRIESIPPAELSVAEVKSAETRPGVRTVAWVPKGRTPRNDMAFAYTVDEAVLVKKKYQEAMGKGRKVIDEKESIEETVRPRLYVLRFQEPGYYDCYYALTIPCKQDAVSVQLEKAGAIRNVECKVSVEARKTYFPTIEEILACYSKRTPLQVSKSGTLQDDATKTIEKREYTVHAENATKFDQMVGELLEETEAKRFVFGIERVGFQAGFTTNVLEPGIRHLVTVKVRPGSRLFLVQGARIDDKEGVLIREPTHLVPVRLNPNERYIYFISKYRPEKAARPLVVYSRLDVFENAQEEIDTTRDFLRGSGLRREQLGELDLLKPE